MSIILKHVVTLTEVRGTELGEDYIPSSRGFMTIKIFSSHNSKCFQHIKTQPTIILVFYEIQSYYRRVILFMMCGKGRERGREREKESRKRKGGKERKGGKGEKGEEKKKKKNIQIHGRENNIKNGEESHKAVSRKHE